MSKERNQEEGEAKYTITGWARICEELPREKGGIFTFTHTIWIYETKWEADGKETDKESKCLGLFPVEFEVDLKQKKLVLKEQAPLLPLVPPGTSNSVDGEASTEDVPEITGDSSQPGLEPIGDCSSSLGIEDGQDSHRDAH